MQKTDSVTQTVLSGSYRFSDYRPLKFLLHPDSHLSKEGLKKNPCYGSEERETGRRTKHR